jgi:hypothetical protein
VIFKLLGPALKHVWQMHMDNEHLQHKAVLLGLKCSCLMEDSMNMFRTEVKWEDHISTEFADCAFHWWACTNGMAAHYNTAPPRRRFLIDVTIKLPMLGHAALEAKYMNPCLGWCYAGDDMMKHTKTMVSCCLQSRSPFKVMDKALKTYVVPVWLKMNPPTNWFRKLECNSSP